MKFKYVAAVCILLLAGSLAQAQAQAPPRPPSHDMPFMGGFQPPAALMSDWWNDPEVANELHLTAQQKQQLEQVSTSMKLALIDAGATGLKSYVRLQALLDADQFDRAAYNQDLDAAATAASKLIKDFGQMALTVRTTLSTEQWHKVEAMKAAGRMRGHPAAMHDRMHERSNPKPPPSLSAPPQ